jgi:hypothetical protein
MPSTQPCGSAAALVIARREINATGHYFTHRLCAAFERNMNGIYTRAEPEAFCTEVSCRSDTDRREVQSAGLCFGCGNEILLLVGVVSLMGSASTQAALIDRGNGLIYDMVLDRGQPGRALPIVVSARSNRIQGGE